MSTNGNMILDPDVLLKFKDQEPREELVQPAKHFSFYRPPIQNIVPSYNIGVSQIYDLIKSSAFQPQTKQLRSLTSKEQARRYKAQNFCYATFSGIFGKRSSKSLISHSDLLTIDFDHVPNLDNVKQQLLNDPYNETVLLFVSPSGDGLKWIISIDTHKETHENYFIAVRNYLTYTYNLEVDKSGKDIARACFIPHDPEVYLNPRQL